MATIDATSASGYAQMDVEDIVRGAGVSRRTFYGAVRQQARRVPGGVRHRRRRAVRRPCGRQRARDDVRGQGDRGRPRVPRGARRDAGPRQGLHRRGARRGAGRGRAARQGDGHVRTPDRGSGAAARSARDHRGGARGRHLRGDTPPGSPTAACRRPPRARAGSDRAHAAAIRRRGGHPGGSARPPATGRSASLRRPDAAADGTPGPRGGAGGRLRRRRRDDRGDPHGDRRPGRGAGRARAVSPTTAAVRRSSPSLAVDPGQRAGPCSPAPASASTGSGRGAAARQAVRGRSADAGQRPARSRRTSSCASPGLASCSAPGHPEGLDLPGLCPSTWG